jgi:hypothetical protein
MRSLQTFYFIWVLSIFCVYVNYENYMKNKVAQLKNFTYPCTRFLYTKKDKNR